MDARDRLRPRAQQRQRLRQGRGRQGPAHHAEHRLPGHRRPRAARADRERAGPRGRVLRADGGLHGRHPRHGQPRPRGRQRPLRGDPEPRHRPQGRAGFRLQDRHADVRAQRRLHQEPGGDHARHQRQRGRNHHQGRAHPRVRPPAPHQPHLHPGRLQDLVQLRLRDPGGQELRHRQEQGARQGPGQDRALPAEHL